MADEWYYQIMGESVGPLSAAQLREKAQAGEITSETWVRKGAEGDWVTADRIRGLLQHNGVTSVPEPKPADRDPVANQLSAPPQPTRPCPFCGETILIVAQKCKHCGEWLYGGRESSDPTRKWPIKWPIKVVPAWNLPVYLMFTCNLYYFFWVYRVIRELHDREATDLTPGKAVGFLFIPFFNFIWNFILWGKIAEAVPTLCAKSGYPRPAIGIVRIAPLAPLLSPLDFVVPSVGTLLMILCYSFGLCTVQAQMNRIAEAVR